MSTLPTEDLVEIAQLLARYAVTITKGDIAGLVSVFTPDGTYSAFGDTYSLSEFPALVAAAPKGLFLTGTAVVEVSGGTGGAGGAGGAGGTGDAGGTGGTGGTADRADTATGIQPLCFVDQVTHEMRIGYYNDTYLRTAAGWRLRTRAMTFMRRNGAHDSGRPHAYQRPEG